MEQGVEVEFESFSVLDKVSVAKDLDMRKNKLKEPLEMKSFSEAS